MKDLSDAEVTALGLQMKELIAAFCEKHRIKYVISASVQKNSDPGTGTHFALCSDPNDPMWAMIAIARSGQALKPLADRQLALMEQTRAQKRRSQS